MSRITATDAWGGWDPTPSRGMVGISFISKRYLGVFAEMRLLYALIENRVKAVSVCSRGSTSRK